MSKKIFTSLAIAILLWGVYVFFYGTRHLAALERADPLFHFPGTTPEHIRETALLLAESNVVLMGSEISSESTSHFHPGGLWNIFADIADKRKVFFASFGWADAIALLMLEASAAEDYQRSADQFLTVWGEGAGWKSSALPRDYDIVFLPGVATNAALFEEAVRGIRQNGRVLKQEVRMRFLCLLTTICFSDRDITFKTSGNLVFERPQKQILPSPYLDFLRDLYNVQPLHESYFGARTPCFGKEGPVAWFLLWRREYPDGTNVFYPKLATNSFFRPLPPGGTIAPQDALVAEAGLSYTYQPETMMYMCPDLSYYPKLSTMLFLVGRVKNQPFISISPQSSMAVLGEINEVEERLVNAKWVSEDDIDSYIAILKKYLAQEKDGESGARDDEAIFRIQVWGTKSGNLQEVFGFVPVGARQYRAIAAGLSKHAVHASTYITRSFIGLAFAVWNPSVWRAADVPIFVFTDVERKVQPLHDFFSVSAILPRGTLEQIHRLSLDGVAALFAHE